MSSATEPWLSTSTRAIPSTASSPRASTAAPTPETVEEIAAYEVAQIRELQPQGPYYIAGYCAGGSIAFESARQLAAAGEEVARVLLFGSPFPAAYRDAVWRSCVL